MFQEVFMGFFSRERKNLGFQKSHYFYCFFRKNKLKKNNFLCFSLRKRRLLLWKAFIFFIFFKGVVFEMIFFQKNTLQRYVLPKPLFCGYNVYEKEHRVGVSMFDPTHKHNTNPTRVFMGQGCTLMGLGHKQVNSKATR